MKRALKGKRKNSKAWEYLLVAVLTLYRGISRAGLFIYKQGRIMIESDHDQTRNRTVCLIKDIKFDLQG
ncbi:hypothetical protein D3C76_883980 [compost metagenome]